MRRWLKWAIALVLVVVLGYAGFVGYVGYRSGESLVHPDREVLAITPANVGLAFERVTFTTSDGIPLVAWWMPASNATGAVVFLHGYGESKNQSLAFAPFLHNASFDVLAFDMRSHGESGGDHTTVGLDEVQDAEAAYAFVQQRAPGEKVALMGLSMGAATAINAASHDARFAAVVSDSSFATLQNIASNSITHFTNLPKYPYGPVAVFFAARIVHKDITENQPVRALKDVHVPVLLIQGGKDDIVVARDDGEALARADPAAQYWFVPEATHVRAHQVAKAEYESRVAAFLGAALA